MRKAFIFCISLIIIGIIVFFILRENESYTYETTLPEEPTDQLIDFFRDKLFYDKYLISNDHDAGEIYEEEPIDESNTSLSYGLSPDAKMHSYYDDRLRSAEEKKYAYNKVNPGSYIEGISDLSNYHLPAIRLEDDQLRIQTATNKSSWTTFQADPFDVDAKEFFSVRLNGIHDDAFYMTAYTKENGSVTSYLLFMTEDLTNYHLIKNEEASINQFMQTESFALYKDVFPVIDENERYLNYFESDQVLDTKNNELLTIDADDYLSDDGKYVYLNGKIHLYPGEGLDEGKQYVQTLENYLAGNDTYEVTFDLDFEDILKASDIGGIGAKVSEEHRNVVYVKDELIVIHVSYDAIFFGNAGETNLLIDFSEDAENPTFYVVDVAAG